MVFRVVEAQRALVAEAGAATRKVRRFAAKQDEARRTAALGWAERGESNGKGACAAPESVDYDQPPRPFDVEIG